MYVYPSVLSGTAYVPDVTAFFALYESVLDVIAFPDESVPKFPPFASNLIEYVRNADCGIPVMMLTLIMSWYGVLPNYLPSFDRPSSHTLSTLTC